METRILNLAPSRMTPAQRFFTAIAVTRHKRNECIIPLERVMEFLDLTEKRNCVRVLKHNFEDGKDFLSMTTKSTGGRPGSEYKLSIDCFKSFCLMSGSSIGKQVRDYYLSLEDEFYSERHLTRPNTRTILALLFAVEMGLATQAQVYSFLEERLMSELPPSDIAEALQTARKKLLLKGEPS